MIDSHIWNFPPILSRAFSFVKKVNKPVKKLKFCKERFLEEDDFTIDKL